MKFHDCRKLRDRNQNGWDHQSLSIACPGSSFSGVRVSEHYTPKSRNDPTSGIQRNRNGVLDSFRAFSRQGVWGIDPKQLRRGPLPGSKRHRWRPWSRGQLRRLSPRRIIGKRTHSKSNVKNSAAAVFLSSALPALHEFNCGATGCGWLRKSADTTSHKLQQQQFQRHHLHQRHPD